MVQRACLRIRSETQVSESAPLNSTSEFLETVGPCFEFRSRNYYSTDLRLDIASSLFTAIPSSSPQSFREANSIERFLSPFNAFSSRFVEIVNETLTSHIRHLVRMHACTCSSLVSFFLGETLHAHDRSNHYLIWLRVEVQKATLSLVTSLRLIANTRRPIRETLASSFAREYIKSCTALSLFT